MWPASSPAPSELASSLWLSPERTGPGESKSSTKSRLPQPADFITTPQTHQTNVKHLNVPAWYYLKDLWREVADRAVAFPTGVR